VPGSQGEIFDQAKPSWVLDCAGRDWCAPVEGIWAWGGARRGPGRLQAAEEKRRVCSHPDCVGILVMITWLGDLAKSLSLSKAHLQNKIVIRRGMVWMLKVSQWSICKGVVPEMAVLEGGGPIRKQSLVGGPRVIGMPP
jgi:hypothetical protein